MTPSRKPKKEKSLSHAPQGYQVMDIPRDGHCLFLACIEAMVHSRLTIPSKWLSKPREAQHRELRKALLNTCANDFHKDPKYAGLKECLQAESETKKGQTLFQDMCDRIKRGDYGQYSELALIACKYNLEIIIFENGTHGYKSQQEAPKKNTLLLLDGVVNQYTMIG